MPFKEHIVRFALFSAAVLLMISCATSPDTVEDPVAPLTVNRTQGFIAEAFKLIASGSPDQLIKAYNLLNSREELSDYGEDLRYLSSWLYNNIYSALPEKIPVVEPVPGSYFSSLTEDISRGVYPVTKIEEGSYLFFILPPMSVLYTHENDTLDIAYESLFAGHSLNPAGTLPQFLLGFVEERRGNFDEAITWYISTLQGSVRCYPAGIGMVRVYLREKRYAEAALILDDLESIMQPTSELAFLRGKTELALGQYGDAYKNLTSSRELGGDSPELFLALAESLYRRNEDNLALDYLTELRDGGWESPESIILEASVYRKIGQRIRALALLSRGLDKYPDNLGMNDLYGQILLETGRTSEGRAQLESGTRQSDGSVETEIMLMQSAVAAELWQEALVYLEQVLKTDRSSNVLKSGVDIYTALGMTEKSLTLLQELKEANPDNPEYPLAITEVNIREKKTEQAANEIEQMKNMDLSDIQRSRLKVSEAEISGSEYNRRKLYEDALFLDIRNVDAVLGLAESWIRNGEASRGMIYLKQAERMSGLTQEQMEKILQLKGIGK